MLTIHWKSWEEIDGYFYSQTAYDWALEHCSGTFVEIGSLLGRSTAYLAQRLKEEGRNISFFAVDTWNGSAGADQRSDDILIEKYGTDWFDAFLENMQRCGVAEYVIPLRMTSLQAATLFANNSIDWLFLDAAHNYESVCEDLHAWYPKVKGVMAGDDYGVDWPGVDQAVDEFKKHEGWSEDRFLTIPPRMWLYRKGQGS